MKKVELFEDKTLDVEGTLHTFAGAADLSQRVTEGGYVDTKLDASQE